MIPWHIFAIVSHGSIVVCCADGGTLYSTLLALLDPGCS